MLNKCIVDPAKGTERSLRDVAAVERVLIVPWIKLQVLDAKTGFERQRSWQ
jgi:hypothetical protein